MVTQCKLSYKINLSIENVDLEKDNYQANYQAPKARINPKAQQAK